MWHNIYSIFQLLLHIKITLRNSSVSVHCYLSYSFLQLYNHSSMFMYHGLLFMFDIQVILTVAINQFVHMCFCIIGGVYLGYLPNSEIGCLKDRFIFLLNTAPNLLGTFILHYQYMRLFLQTPPSD